MSVFFATKRTALWEVTGDEMFLEQTPDPRVPHENFYLKKGELFMTTGARYSRWWHQVLSRHGVLWAHSSTLVWREPAKDNRQAKRVT
jgi:hypothetical protein